MISRDVYCGVLHTQCGRWIMGFSEAPFCVLMCYFKYDLLNNLSASLIPLFSP